MVYVSVQKLQARTVATRSHDPVHKGYFMHEGVITFDRDSTGSVLDEQNKHGIFPHLGIQSHKLGSQLLFFTKPKRQTHINIHTARIKRLRNSQKYLQATVALN